MKIIVLRSKTNNKNTIKTNTHRGHFPLLLWFYFSAIVNVSVLVIMEHFHPAVSDCDFSHHCKVHHRQVSHVAVMFSLLTTNYRNRKHCVCVTWRKTRANVAASVWGVRKQSKQKTLTIIMTSYYFTGATDEELMSQRFILQSLV